MVQNKLKELTWENHKKAERTGFIKRLLKKELSTYQYYVYLCNQLLAYSQLEYYAKEAGILDGIEEICRLHKLSIDIFELEREYKFVLPVPYKNTILYLNHINDIKEDRKRLLAHVYVRHMGDLYGGQTIKKYVPAKSILYYEFDGDITQIKENLRSRLDDTLAEESNICFQLIQDFFNEMEIDFANMESVNKLSTANS